MNLQLNSVSAQRGIASSNFVVLHSQIGPRHAFDLMRREGNA